MSAALLPLLLMHAAPTVAHARQASAGGDAGEQVRRSLEAAAPAIDFTTAQLRHSRVLQARLQMRFGIKRLFRERGIPYPAEQIFIRVFKRERTLELWVRSGNSDRFSLLKQYMICALAGELGPKRSQGDGQTPEGFYESDHFNPSSIYLLSLHLNYPNRSDRILGGVQNNLGGDIFIHGGCETEGCIAVTDDAIKELYWIGVEARAAGQQRIPVHIFPARLTAEELDVLRRKFADRPDLLAFWSSLKPGFDHFENTRQLPPIRIDPKGHYGLLGEVETAATATTARAR
jgi:hypothetical protein